MFERPQQPDTSGQPPLSPEQLKRQQFAEILREEKTKAREKLMAHNLINENDPLPERTMEQVRKKAQNRFNTEIGTEERKEVAQDEDADATVLTYKGDRKEGDTYIIRDYDEEKKAA